MNINVICIGKIKDQYITEGIKEFAKRLGPFCKFKIIELKEDGNDNNRKLSIERESKDIIEILQKYKGYSILLDIFGESLSSEEMADKLGKIAVNGESTINLIIGGSYGVSDEIKSKVNFRLSFSRFTYPHQLMRLILIEQIYRWFSILKNTKYHK